MLVRLPDTYIDVQLDFAASSDFGYPGRVAKMVDWPLVIHSFGTSPSFADKMDGKVGKIACKND